jgi:hypothetical protein
MTPASIVAAMVKPLVWDEGRYGRIFAKTAVGQYSVRDYADNGLWLLDIDGTLIGQPTTLAAAQAAAEADHVARIAAALDMDAVVALVEAATPYVSLVQNADYGRQLRQHDALVAALARFTQQEPKP